MKCTRSRLNGDPAIKQAHKSSTSRFDFDREQVVKWNCVFRRRQAEPIKPGDYSFQLYVVIGTREDCRRTLASLAQEFAGR